MKFSLDHDDPDVAGRVLAGSGHAVTLLRQVAGTTITDAEVLKMAKERSEVLVTCNRDDFLELARTEAHGGIVILIRRRSRASENGKLLALIAKAGESGIVGNINFA
jgi:predicted nuclease of predicted toxin-antitoxin system